MLFIDVKGIIDNEEVKAMMEWWGGATEVFTVEALRHVLAENPDEKELTLNIDCDGGSVYEGLKIYDELRMSGKVIHTNITGGCHSMAVVLLLSAPEENRSANKNVRALIHRVYAGVCDMISAEDCLDMAEDLMMEEDAILDIYAERTGVDREKLKSVMREEKIHDAKSLKSLNFISKINTYNTNQFFNSFKSMANKPKSAYHTFMERLNAYRKRNEEEAAETVYEYKDENGDVVFTSATAPDDLAEGTAVELTSGETSGTFVLDNGKEVVITDNVVESINDSEEQSLEERVEELEELIEEATNVIKAQERELRNYRGSNHKPAERKTAVPAVKGKDNKAGDDKRTKEDIKAAANERMQKVSNRRTIIPEKK